MRKFWFCLVLPAFLNCSGENVVAGKDKTQSEKLEASLPAWCKSTCNKLQACEPASGCSCSGDVCECAGGGVGDDCVEDCEQEMSRWAKGGEACAAIGEQLQRCIDRAGCDVLESDGDCRTTAAERAACPDESDGPTPDVTEPGTGGSTNTLPLPAAGSSTYGGNGNSGGNSAGPNPVTCQAITGSGSAGSSSSPLLCETTFLECSDGHEYQWSCVSTSETKNVCSCYIDGAVQSAFEWTNSCPEVQQVDVACGFSLSEQ